MHVPLPVAARASTWAFWLFMFLGSRIRDLITFSVLGSGSHNLPCTEEKYPTASKRRSMKIQRSSPSSRLNRILLA